MKPYEKTSIAVKQEHIKYSRISKDEDDKNLRYQSVWPCGKYKSDMHAVINAAM